jgi:hypothetical protein
MKEKSGLSYKIDNGQLTVKFNQKEIARAVATDIPETHRDALALYGAFKKTRDYLAQDVSKAPELFAKKLSAVCAGIELPRQNSAVPLRDRVLAALSIIQPKAKAGNLDEAAIKTLAAHPAVKAEMAKQAAAAAEKINAPIELGELLEKLKAK